MSRVYRVTAALLLGIAATPLEPLGAQNIMNARNDPGRWAWTGYGAYGSLEMLPVTRRAIFRRLRAGSDPEEMICIGRFRTGSLNFERVCGSRQEWALLLKTTR